MSRPSKIARSTDGERHLVLVRRFAAPPDNHIVTIFEPEGGGTVMTVRMALPDAETRRAILDSGMVDGMEVSYGRLDGLVGKATDSTPSIEGA